MTQQSAEGDVFWDDNDPEYSHESIADIMGFYADREVICVQRAVRLSDVFVVRIDGNDHAFGSMEAVETWVDSIATPEGES